MKLPEDVKVILDKLYQEGYEGYVVGGCVRDTLLGKKPKDWDICTNAKPNDILRVFKGYPIIPTGLKHGTVTVMVHNVGYEITTYRIDGEYSDGRHPDSVTFTSNLAEDLARRDFTINAMAYSEIEGIVDLYGGVKDLQKGLIRCVGKPLDRFDEDALRIMRAMRFASVLNFYIDEKTSNAMFTLYKNLDKIAKERINVELSKLLLGKGRYRIMKKYTDILSYVIPEIKPMIGFEQNSIWHNSDVWGHTLKVVKYVDNNDLNTSLAALLHDIGKPDTYTEVEGVGHFYGHYKRSVEIAENVLKELKFSNDIIDEVLKLIEYHDLEVGLNNKFIRRMMNKLSEPTLRKLIVLKHADILGQSQYQRTNRLQELKDFEELLNNFKTEEECFSLKQLQLNGKDLISLGYKPSKDMGIILNRVLEKVVEEELPNEKEELIKFVKGAFPVGNGNLREIAQDTIEISKTGSFVLGNRLVKLDTENKTKLFTDNDFENVYNVVRKNNVKNKTVSFEIRNEGTVDAVFRLGNKVGNLGILNFASAHHPGGGFENGAVAQEECLAYCSDLYVKQISGDGQKYYEINAENHTPLYTDTMFMSNVTFFRDSKYNKVVNPITCNVLTVPAVNMGVSLRQGIDYKKANAVMKNRMRKLLYLFAYYNCDTIVLGAFGCGVFGNKAEDVAQFWRELLVEENLAVYFKKIVFSIYDRPNSKSNCDIFKTVLGETAKK